MQAMHAQVQASERASLSRHTAAPRCMAWSLTESTFVATEMVAGGEVAFEAMTVDQLKVELAECGLTRLGRKAILQHRLHALIVQAAIEQSGDEMDV